MKITINNIFVENVQVLLAKRKWSGYRLAVTAGIHPSTISRIMDMKHSTSLDVVEKIAAALGTTAAQLLKN